MLDTASSDGISNVTLLWSWHLLQVDSKLSAWVNLRRPSVPVLPVVTLHEPPKTAGQCVFFAYFTHIQRDVEHHIYLSRDILTL